MPYAKCPDCGRLQHYSVSEPLEAWHQKHAPGTKPGEVVSLLCYFCQKKGKPTEEPRTS